MCTLLAADRSHISAVVIDVDSFAVPLRTALLHIATAPAVYARLRRELDAAAASGLLDRPARHCQATLPYLRAVVDETLRIAPSPMAAAVAAVAIRIDSRPPGRVTSLSTSTVGVTDTTTTMVVVKKVPNPLFASQNPTPAETATLVGGYTVPDGTPVCLNLVGVMRAPQYWGADADVFRPERWLRDTESDDDADEEARREQARRVALMAQVLRTQWGLQPREQESGHAKAGLWLGKVLVDVSSFPPSP